MIDDGITSDPSILQPREDIQKTLGLSDSEITWLEKPENKQLSKDLESALEYLNGEPIEEQQSFKEYCKQVVFLLSTDQKEKIPDLFNNETSRKNVGEKSYQGLYDDWSELTTEEKSCRFYIPFQPIMLTN